MPVIVLSAVYVLIEYDFFRTVADAVHSSDPLHLIFFFEQLSDTLLLCYLLNQSGKHILGLLVNFNEMGV